MRGFALVVTLAGCNAAFGLGKTVLVDAPSCIPIASDFDDFEQATATPCSWGYLTHQQCTAVAANGELDMTPAAGVTSSICLCGTNTPMSFTPMFGTMAEVLDIAREAGQYTQFVASDAAGPSWSIGYAGSGMLYFNRDTTRLGLTPWDASSRWWRIRPDEAGAAVLGEVSPDGKTWSAIAMDPTVPPAMIKPSFSTGTFQAVTAPSTARLGSINVCPP